FLLIDEPTNHLDVKAREMVAAYLKKKKGFILVSHDRRFLDGCVDHILSLNRASIEVQSGNFSSWMANFERQQEFEMAQNERLKKDISRLQQAAKRSAIWSDRVEASKIGAADKGYVGHKAAKMMKRSKTIEARQQQAIEQKSGLLNNFETAENLKIAPLLYHVDTLVSMSDVAICYDGNTVSEPVSFTIQRGDRVVLDGKNGSGKSSLLKLLVGEPIEHSGMIQLGSGLVISYVPQDTSHLKGMLSDFADENHIDESLFKAILRKMDFERIQFEKDIQDFSGGQKKKVLIAKSLCEQAHLYVWDEPLNFIDVYSRMQIEQLIKEYSPTMIFVEHDSAFRETVATKTVQL
ncbi:MAG: ATP-binding cassette domain-containing protein, partial [Oscillospiraceae bacterium]|nr:ATP-binding cassette domain-containing protein [Oscillospiraceae bacterium]